MASARIEDHALLSDRRTAALVTREGVVDWLCVPRFDSPAAFCSLLGDAENGHWTLRIADGRVVSRRYLPGTMILETVWRGPEGTATVTEFLPLGGLDGPGGLAAPDEADLVRHVECIEGRVVVEQELRVRFEYGAVVPWMRRVADAEGGSVLTAVAGGEAIALRGPGLEPQDHSHGGRHPLAAGEEQSWVLTWYPSWQEVPPAPDPLTALGATARHWSQWLGQVRVDARYEEAVGRSLLVLSALTHRETGGIVAAPTTSLPEDLGGERNWDYRYCWLRDAALSLEALLAHDHTEAATRWRDWLLRAIAGDPEHLQIMYGVDGDRELPERELAHLAGYEDSRPVRVGNGAVSQFQADVVGEVMIALAMMRERRVAEDAWSWPLQKALVRFAAAHVDEPDHGIWEMRGEPAFFTHGRVMTWATFDRAVSAVEHHGLPADPEEVDSWRALRDRLRAEVLERGVGPDGAFTQTYGSTEVDASLLQIPHTGFLPADDARMLATVARIEQDLVVGDGFVLRYRTQGQDGLRGDEHPFLVCCFWLVEQYVASGRREDGEALLARLLDTAGDLYLLAEEYDPVARRMIGNFPQAFSHLGLIRAVDALSGEFATGDAPDAREGASPTD